MRARTLLLVLAIANILFGAWAIWIDRDTPQAAGATGVQIPQLQLASENAVAAKPPSTQLASTAALTECFSLGPLPDGDVSAGLAETLRAGGYQPRQREESQQLADGFWVYVGGIADADEQLRTVAAIRYAGIDDASVPEPNPGNQVSVGLFSERARAQRRAEQVRALGFDAQVEEHRRRTNSWWLDVDRRAGEEALRVGDFLQLLSLGTDVEVHSCPVPGAPPVG